MKIPNVPNVNIINEDKGLSHTWMAFFQNLITQMRLNLSDAGYIVPFLDDTQITALSTTDNVGRIVYNTTTQRMMINNSGTFQNIDVS
jgi:hypothetical protein